MNATLETISSSMSLTTVNIWRASSVESLDRIYAAWTPSGTVLHMSTFIHEAELEFDASNYERNGTEFVIDSVNSEFVNYGMDYLVNTMFGGPTDETATVTPPVTGSLEWATRGW